MKRPLYGIIFSQYEDEIDQKREKKNLVSNSVHTRPGHENLE